jgi:hypothetical protein
MMKLPVNRLSSASFLVFVLISVGLALNWQNVAFTWAVVADRNEPFGFIDKKGKMVIDLRKMNQYKASNCFFHSISDGSSLVFTQLGDTDNNGFLKNKYMFLNLNGAFMGIDRTFERAHDFSEGLAAVDLMNREPWSSSSSSSSSLDDPRQVNDDWCFIDKSGAVKFGSFGEVNDFSEGLAGVRKKNSCYWQFVDKNGSKAISGPFTAVGPFSQGRAAVCVNEKWGLIDRAGKIIVEPKYEKQIQPFHENFAAVEVPSAKRLDYLNADGEIVLSVDRTPALNRKIIRRNPEKGGGFALVKGPYTADYELSTINCDVSEGLVVIERNGKYGYADLVGRTVITPRFDYCWPFSEGRGRVFQQGLAKGSKGSFGYVDRVGNEIVPCKLDEASDFSDGCAVVTQHNSDRCEYVDYSGRNVFGKTYRRATSFHEGFALVGQPSMDLF